MRRPILSAGTLAAVLIAFGAAAEPAVVSRLDHIPVEDADADGLFHLLTEKLGLPVDWPMVGYGAFTSGGVSFGNAVVEVGRFGPAPLSARVGAAAWLPATSAAASLAELDRRGVGHDPLEPHMAGGRTLWTILTVKVGPAGFHTFICDYGGNPGRERAARDLRRRHGGALGVVGVRELMFEAADLPAAKAQWAGLLQPTATLDGDRFRLPAGPSIRLVAGGKDRLAAVVVEVASLARAEAALKRLKLAYRAEGDRLDLSPGLHGMALQLVQATPAS